MQLIIFSLVLIVVGWTNGEKEEPCSVTITNGTIVGKRYSLNSKQVCAYTGIPFAAPPVGSLRFKNPQPCSGWVGGVLNATSLPNWCPQSKSPIPGVTISENCLYLNVWQPKINGSSKAASNNGLPVMIWFHGGSFTSGSSFGYEPTKLLARGDIIYVSAHYRLGVLGFLSTSDAASPGNFGLKDQAFAIKWVSENIGAWGGRADKITIFGESAGGASVMYQFVSPLNRGLLNGVISQSGTALASWTMHKNPLESASNMAKRLNCPVDTTSNLVSCMREISWERIIQEQEKYAVAQMLNLSLALGSVTPVVEPNLPGAFITNTPLNIMTWGEIPDIPVMIGANKHDGSFVTGSLYVSLIGPLGLDRNPTYLRERLVPDILKFFGDYGDEANRGMGGSVEMAYLWGKNRSNWGDVMPGIVDMITVHGYKSSVERSAELLSRRGRNAYVYSFEHHSLNTLWSLFFGAIDMPVDHGIGHGDELIYLFDFPAEYSDADERMSEIMVDLWLDFANNGNPTPSKRDVDAWQPYNWMDETYMKLNVTPTLQHGYRNTWRPNGFEWE